MKNYLILPLVLFLSACGSAQIEQVKPVEVKTIEISRPAPIVPPVDQLSLRPVSWIIITPDNIEEQFAKIQKGELVLFAVTADGYQNIALNLSDIRALIEQQNRIIAVYKKQYK
jgi:hypothetical protein